MLDNIKHLDDETYNIIIKYSDIVKYNLPSSFSTATPHKSPTTIYS